MISNKISECGVEKKVKKCIMRIYADLVLEENFQIFVEKAAFFMMMLSAEYLSATNLKAIEACMKVSNVKVDEIISDVSPDEKPALEFIVTQESKKRNRFVDAILERLEERQLLNSQARTSFKNPFRNEKFSSYFIKNNLPFCCLWGSFFSPYTTNNIVECYNKIVKNDLMKSQLREKPARFLKCLRENTLANLKLLSYGIKVKASGKKDVEDFTEKFKKKKKMPDYFQKKTPDALKIVNVDIDLTNDNDDRKKNQQETSTEKDRMKKILLSDPNCVSDKTELHITNFVSYDILNIIYPRLSMIFSVFWTAI